MSWGGFDGKKKKAIGGNVETIKKKRCVSKQKKTWGGRPIKSLYINSKGKERVVGLEGKGKVSYAGNSTSFKQGRWGVEGEQEGDFRDPKKVELQDDEEGWLEFLGGGL